MEVTLDVSTAYHRFTSSPVFNRISLTCVSQTEIFVVSDMHVLFVLSVCCFVTYYSDFINLLINDFYFTFLFVLGQDKWERGVSIG